MCQQKPLARSVLGAVLFLIRRRKDPGLLLVITQIFSLTGIRDESKGLSGGPVERTRFAVLNGYGRKIEQTKHLKNRCPQVKKFG